MKFQGILGGPLVATFTMGVVFPFANQKGVITGALTGCLFGWMIFTGQKFDVKDNYLKNIIPATIDFDECSDPNWVSDVRNFVSGKSGTFEGCEQQRLPYSDNQERLESFRLRFRENIDGPF